VAGAGYGFCGVRVRTVHSRVASRHGTPPRVDAGKGTAYAVERPEWRSLQPRRNKAREPRPAIRACGFAAKRGASLRRVPGRAQRPAE